MVIPVSAACNLALPRRSRINSMHRLLNSASRGGFTPSLIILVPVLLPVVTQLGVDPLHFGIVLVVNLAIGMVTPPLGVCLFVGCSISGISLEAISRAVWPFILVMIVDVLLLTYIPWITTVLPKLAGIY